MFKSVVVLCLLVGTIMLMHFFDAPLKNEISPAGIVSFELAKDVEKSALILTFWNASAISSAGKSLYFDFLFLCIYSTFIAMLIFKMNRKLKVKKRYLPEIMMDVVFLAAFFEPLFLILV